MSETPPQQYVTYPRNNTPETYGTIEQLEALGKAYFGYSILFLCTILASVAGIVFAYITDISYRTNINPYFIQAPIVLVVVSLGSYPLNTKIAFAKNWPSAAALAASILMGLNAILCCGIIGFAVMQSIATKEIKKYGMPTGTFSLTGKKFKAFVEARRKAQSNPMPPGTV